MLTVLAAFVAGCQTPSVSRATAVLRQKLGRITLDDGVSESEAKIIAQAYFAAHVGCGAFTGIRDAGELWIVDGKFGYAGDPISGFYIDKRSGKLTSPIGQSYDDPRKIFD
jgi:hypothetical protein